MRRVSGFTTVELIVVLAIIGILAAIAIPSYISFKVRAKEAIVRSDCHSLQLEVEDWAIRNNGRYPVTLDERGVDGRSVLASLRSWHKTDAELPLVNAFTGKRTEPGGEHLPGSIGYDCYYSIDGRFRAGYKIHGFGAKGIEIVLLSSGS